MVSELGRKHISEGAKAAWARRKSAVATTQTDIDPEIHRLIQASAVNIKAIENLGRLKLKREILTFLGER